MFDQLIELIQKMGTAVLPWVVVDQWQQGIVLRFGKYHRTIDPGFHWLIPIIDTTVIQSVVMTTTALRPQTVVTQDGKVITTEAVVRWSVSDIKAFTLDIWDGSNVIIDNTQGAIAEALRSLEFDSPDVPKKVLAESRKALRKYGIAVDAVTLTTMAPVKVLRLIGAHQVQEQQQV